MSAPTPAGAPTGPKTLTALLHEYADVVVTASAAIPWSAMPPENELQWDDEGLVLPDVYLVIRGPKLRVDGFFAELDQTDPGLWLLYEFSYTDAPTPQPPRGAAPTSTTPFGVPAPGAGPVEAGTHGPTAPRGSTTNARPDAPDDWDVERAAAYTRSVALGRVALAATVVAWVVAVVLVVTR